MLNTIDHEVVAGDAELSTLVVVIPMPCTYHACTSHCRCIHNVNSSALVNATLVITYFKYGVLCSMKNFLLIAQDLAATSLLRTGITQLLTLTHEHHFGEQGV